MTSGKGAFGTTLQIGDAATPTEAFTTIAEVFGDIAGPTMTQDTIEMTSHSSANRMKEYIAGLSDGGEISFEFNKIKDNVQQELLRTKVSAGTPSNFKLVWPDTEYATFTAIVTAYAPAAPHEGKLTASCTLKITGAITYT